MNNKFVSNVCSPKTAGESSGLLDFDSTKDNHCRTHLGGVSGIVIWGLEMDDQNNPASANPEGEKTSKKTLIFAWIAALGVIITLVTGLGTRCDIY